MKQAVVAVIRAGNRVLVIQRGPAAMLSGYWSLPSGRIEPGESQPETVVREMREELGLEVLPIAKIWECRTDDELYLLHWWSVDVAGGKLRPNPGEVAEVAWANAEEFSALNPTFAADHRFFEFFQSVLPRLNKL